MAACVPSSQLTRSAPSAVLPNPMQAAAWHRDQAAGARLAPGVAGAAGVSAQAVAAASRRSNPHSSSQGHQCTGFPRESYLFGLPFPALPGVRVEAQAVMLNLKCSWSVRRDAWKQQACLRAEQCSVHRLEIAA